MHTYGTWEVSAAPPAQNGPKLHFRFILFFIQPHLPESLSCIARAFDATNQAHDLRDVNFACT